MIIMKMVVMAESMESKLVRGAIMVWFERKVSVTFPTKFPSVSNRHYYANNSIQSNDMTNIKSESKIPNQKMSIKLFPVFDRISCKPDQDLAILNTLNNLQALVTLRSSVAGL